MYINFSIILSNTESNDMGLYYLILVQKQEIFAILNKNTSSKRSCRNTTRSVIITVI